MKHHFKVKKAPMCCGREMPLVDVLEDDTKVYECACGRSKVDTGNTPPGFSPETPLTAIFERNERAQGRGYDYARI